MNLELTPVQAMAVALSVTDAYENKTLDGCFDPAFKLLTHLNKLGYKLDQHSSANYEVTSPAAILQRLAKSIDSHVIEGPENTVIPVQCLRIWVRELNTLVEELKKKDV